MPTVATFATSSLDPATDWRSGTRERSECSSAWRVDDRSLTWNSSGVVERLRS